MPRNLVRRCVDVLARKAGYIPPTEVAKLLAEKDQIERELRHKTRNLEHQIQLRDQMEREVGFLRELQLTYARKDSGVHQAVCRLEQITAALSEMMQDTWPAAITEVPDPTAEATV